MANQLASDKPAPPAEKTYSEAEVRAAVAEANTRALAEANAQLQQAAMARNVTPQAPRGPDGFDVFAKEGLTRSPEEQARMLRGGAAGVVRNEMSQAVAQLRQESAWELARAKDEMAMRSVLAANPEIAADQEGFAAAMAKAAWRADQRGAQLDGPSMAQMAVSVYREDHKPAASDAPFTEGASTPNPGGPVAPKKEGPSPVLDFLKENYGVGGAGDEVHGEARNFASEDAVNDYLDARMKPENMGDTNVWGISRAAEESMVRQVKGSHLERQARRAAAGGK